MLNYIWLGLVLLAVIIGGYNGALDQVTKNGFDMAKVAVMEIALPLSAIMTIWLGIMRLAEKSGLVQILARAMRPVMRWLFPEVPVEHPAMGAMLMNMAANMLGLNNAATPLGLRAMLHLQKLNPHPGTATNAMCMFLTINTSSIQLIPATAVAILAAAGSANPTAIVGTAFLATLCSTAAGITFAKIFEKFRSRRQEKEASSEASAISEQDQRTEPQLEMFVEPPQTMAKGKLLLTIFVALFAYFFLTIVFPEFRLQKVLPGIFPEMSDDESCRTNQSANHLHENRRCHFYLGHSLFPVVLPALCRSATRESLRRIRGGRERRISSRDSNYPFSRRHSNCGWNVSRRGRNRSPDQNAETLFGSGSFSH